ncbi:hypothetical protein EHQ12_10720 [Leptospira gomenensis]|uniref:Galactose oxidase n=1 Tax=Leptospira gomenensis TaxID=2484974 RepID=A0A5F1YFC2_9LEPT|nr:hypothetical protein [Leptospira gomenensis]TGK38206.1 hypothetical protein EHQ12_10720 [Leptospira gomenensis]TGK38432.1 hypothetical protein EHQ17_01975 [Leptospira gomenensis]TGK52246.1 hypothetical protein EHQ07_01395 [Leptospira gomenensis]TGK55767.1 hypothetical protein EHQ13_16535 [Leptospira gomenensis]
MNDDEFKARTIESPKPDPVLKNTNLNLYNIILYIILLLFSYCNGSPLTQGRDAETAKIKLAYVSALSSGTATLTWECTSSRPGAVLYGKAGIEAAAFSLQDSKIHTMTLRNLQSDTDYVASVFCTDQIESLEGIPLAFKTWVSDFPNRTRGLWLIGGIGTDSHPVPQIDLYDPVTSTWYPSVTTQPTPRAYANVVSHKEKIYIIGGLERQGAAWVASRKVEVYDPYADVWIEFAGLPVANQGGVVASIEDAIYIVSGTTTTDMTTGTVLNSVVGMVPESGVWNNYTSPTPVFARVDMTGCGLGGSILISGGRFYLDGTPQSTSDAYVPSVNSTTSAGEPAINPGRHGAAGVCIRPKPTDAYPTDPEWFTVLGGSTGTATTQPAAFLVPSNRTDFYQIGTAGFVGGPVLPASLYYPGAQASYETRKLYVMGGASSLNVPSDVVYSINLQNPIAGAWNPESQKMPVPRYAHKVVRIDR